MARFDKGDWVQPRGASTRCGQVVGRDHSSYRVRWLGSTLVASVGGRALRPAHTGLPCALLLEGSLDRPLTTRRTESLILGDWLQSMGELRLAYKNIHRLDDLRELAGQIRRTPYLFAHFNCHGEIDDKRGPYITLSPRERPIYLLDDQSVRLFRECFEGRELLLSACKLGTHEKYMLEFKRRAGLRCLAACCRDVYDYEATVFDLCVYLGMLHMRLPFRSAVHKAVAAVRQLGVKGGGGKWRSLVRVF